MAKPNVTAAARAKRSADDAQAYARYGFSMFECLRTDHGTARATLDNTIFGAGQLRTPPCSACPLDSARNLAAATPAHFG
jgi:hypothetical protein